MDPNTSKYFDNYYDLFSHPGWKQLIDNLKANLKVAEDISYLKTLENLYEAKGAKKVLEQIINYKDLIDQEYAELTQEPDYE